MKDFYARGISITALICAGSFLLTASPGPSLAQRGSPGATAAGRRTETLNRQGEQHERDKLSREGTVPENAPGGHRRAQDLAEQVKRDFEGLQAAYNRIVLAMAPEGRPDFEGRPFFLSRCYNARSSAPRTACRVEQGRCRLSEASRSTES